MPTSSARKPGSAAWADAAGTILQILIAGLSLQLAGAQTRPSVPSSDRAATPLDDIHGAPPVATTAPVAAVLDDFPEARRLFETARDRFADNDPEGALQALRTARNESLTPIYEVVALQAQVEARLGRTADARASAQLALSIRPAAATMHELLGRHLLRSGDRPAALAHFRSATLAADREPRNAAVTAAWFELGQVLEAEGYRGAAVEAWREFDLLVWEDSPEHRAAPEVADILSAHPRGAVELRVAVLTELGRAADAVAVAKSAVDRTPDDPILTVLYLESLCRAGQAAEAFALAKARLAAGSSGGADNARGAVSPKLIDAAIRAAGAAGCLDGWIGELGAEVRAGRDVASAAAISKGMQRLGKAAAALALCEALGAAQPDSGAAAVALAAAHRATGDFPRAVQTLADFVRRSADRAQIPDMDFTSWMRSARVTDEFLRYVSSFSTQPNQDFAVLFVQGLFALAADQRALAEQLLLAAVRRKPEFTLANVALGRLYLAQYRWEDARKQAESVIARDPRRADAQIVLAAALDGLDQVEAAGEAYRKAVKLQPDEPASALAAARFARRTGDRLAAQRFFQQALDLAPADEVAFEGAAERYLLDNKAEIARTLIERARRLGIDADVLRRVQTLLYFPLQHRDPGYVDELRRQHAAHPDDAVTARRLADALIIRDDLAAARGVLETVIELSPEDDTAVYQLALIQYRQLDYDRAIRGLSAVAQKFPNRIAILALLAECLLADFRLEPARTVLHKLEATELPGTETRRRLRGRLLGSWVEFGDFDPALAQLDQWLKDGSDAEWLNLTKLLILRAAGRHSTATELADSLVKQAREGQSGALDLDVILPAAASAYLGAEDANGAEPLLREALQRAPGSWGLVESLVGALLAGKRYPEALGLLSGFTPRNAIDVYNVLGLRAQVRAAAGDIELALSEVQSVLDEPFVQNNPPIRDVFRERLIRILEKAGRTERALELVDKWLAESPLTALLSRFEMLSLRQSLNQRLERDDEYIRDTDQLLELAVKLEHPALTGIQNDLGYTCAERGERMDEALQWTRNAVAAQPLNAAFLDSLAWVYYRRGDFAAADQYLSRATRLRQGQDPVLLDHLGDAQYRLGDREAAGRSWQRALVLIGEEKEPPRKRDALTAAVREKLAALKQGGPVSVAPVVGGGVKENTTP